MSESPLTQPSLLVRLRDRGDDRAWSEFVEIYTPLIQRLARQKGLQEADAADLVQEVFGAVARWIDRYDPDPSKGTFRGWLSRIARNQILDALAARRRHPQGVGDSSMRRLLDAQPAPSPEDTALFEVEYRRRAFAWAAERVRDEVSEMAWRVFWMAGVEGTNAKAVAEALGTTVGTVYHYKSQVMARLRRKVQELDGEPDRGFEPGESR
ncbi:MAG TPA: sigma-70 family RNA polymerase sigma factor [Isosphaeraceae bacterium]|nr:sigma-70 family RNA polymerase sigma factor [Isosphaeraceae bacterium]